MPILIIRIYRFMIKGGLIRKSTKILSFILCVVTLFVFIFGIKPTTAAAMPFYDLRPQDLVERSKFSTQYKTSTAERKHNVYLAAKSLDNVLVDVGAEFSFNATVGERTEQRGYKNAKIIVDGEFVDGVGGGVCQVSTTMYNALLLAGLEITEFHPHSLAVSYVPPSFDAMVNSGWADLRFINNTHNPIIINSIADGQTLTIKIIGEPLNEEYRTKSVVTGEIPAPKEEEIDDEKGEYPELYEGEKMFVKYSKAGITSDGYLLTVKDGKTSKIRKIRSDKYKPIRGLVINGKAKPKEENIEELQPEQDEIILIEDIYRKLHDNLWEKFLNYKKYFDKYNFL